MPLVGAVSDGRRLLGGNNTTNAPEDVHGEDFHSNSVQAEAVGRYLSNLACPCNCTYVSKSCCASGSGIVHEEREKHLGAWKSVVDEEIGTGSNVSLTS